MSKKTQNNSNPYTPENCPNKHNHNIFNSPAVFCSYCGLRHDNSGVIMPDMHKIGKSAK